MAIIINKKIASSKFEILRCSASMNMCSVSWVLVAIKMHNNPKLQWLTKSNMCLMCAHGSVGQ